MKVRDLVALFALAALWGASFLFIRVAAPAFGAFPLAAGRVLIAAAVLYAVMRASGIQTSLREHARKLMALGALNAAIPFALIAAAELQLTASMAAMLNATVPLRAATFGAMWLGERFTIKRSIGLLLGVLGVTVLVGWSPISLTAPLIASIVAVLVATASYALAGIYTKRQLTGASTGALTLGQQRGAAVWLLGPCPRADIARASDRPSVRRASAARVAVHVTRVSALLPSDRQCRSDAHNNRNVSAAAVRYAVGCTLSA